MRFSPVVEPPPQPPFILAVASPSPHKNLDGLVEAFAHVPVVRPDVTLRLAGMHTPTSGGLMVLAQQLRVGDAVEFLGRVRDDQLVDLYRPATVMAFPSLDDLSGLANRLRHRSLARASLFPWAETARRTRGVYRSLVDGV